MHYEISDVDGSGNKFPGRPLGRHVNHDVRSFGFAFQAEPKKLMNVYWPRHTNILDQGNLGSCTGNAMCGACATGALWDGLPANHADLDEPYAIKLYSQATSLDPFKGAYPPTDTGSDGVSVCKAAVNEGLISGYTHTFDLNTALQAIMTGPVITGFNWYSSFDSPTVDGTVAITSGAFVRGGHEVVIRGISADNRMVLLDNSWGKEWGNMGSFKFSFDTFARLLAEDGDVTVPLPLSAPSPKPTPVIFTANGVFSLLDISNKRTTPVSTILRNTLQQYKAFTSGMSAYLQNNNMSLPLPSGEQLCLAWPQYSIG